MKIAHINTGIYPYAAGDPTANGGSERYQWLLARAQAAAGWSVTVGVREVLQAGERKTIDGVEFVGLDQGQILPAWYRFFASERPDWCLLQCASHWWGPAVAVAKLAGARTIFSAMNDTDVQPRRALFRRPRWWPLYAWGLSWSDRIFVQHGGQLSQLPARWQPKASIFPGIVHQPTTIKPHGERRDYVAWVGVLRQHKRPDRLVEIARQAPDIRFVVCGGPTTFRAPPGYGEQIAAALRALPNVDYLGHVAPDKTLRVIAEASLLLSTSDEEGFPSVFLEAWASGTPVVSLEIDPDQIVRRAELGKVSGNTEVAVADIRDLLASPQGRDEIAARARRHVGRAHSEAAAIQAFKLAIRGKRFQYPKPRRS
jgi:glycosyltransferase involved in cell wall biosynthesis